MRKILLAGFLTIFALAGLINPPEVYGQATLKHSYTFEEGTYDATTVYDQEGSLNGTLVGSKIGVADGKVTVSGATGNNEGWISFDGVELDLKSYSAVTLEAYLETGDVLNTTFTMLAYFGSTTQGSNCFWIQPTRAATETRIEANNGSTTITALLSGYEVDDNKKHHLVAVLNADALIYYLDGVIIAETSTAGANYVSSIGTDIAQLFKGPDGWPDPNYNASVLEFNIYDGTLPQKTIATRAGEFLGLDLTNAKLDTITTSVGTLDPAFDPDVDVYELEVPYGTTSVFFGVESAVGGVQVDMMDGFGESFNGTFEFAKDDGDAATIKVTALDGVSYYEYIIDVFPTAGEAAATLEDIQLSAGKFISAFDMDDTAYVAIVPPGTTTVTVTGVPNWTNANVQGNGDVTLVDGMGSATLTVTSEDGTATKVYTVELFTTIVQPSTDFYLVHEVNGFVCTESGNSFNQVVLAEAVKDSATQIWQFIDSGEEGEYFIQNKAGHYMCISRTSANVYDLEVYPDLPSVDLDSARFLLDEFEPGRFRIESKARRNVSASNFRMGPNNGNLGSPMYIDKWRSAANDPLTVFHIKLPGDVVSDYDLHLDTLAITGASMSPAFNPAYPNYYVTIPAGMTTVDVMALAADPDAVNVTGAGSVDVSAGSGKITITVEAKADPQAKRDYVLTYIVDAPLTMTHSYTFDDGTANDQVGTADGTVHGGTFADNSFVAEAEGDYIVLPAAEIALNTYPSFTMEAHVTTGANPGWTMYTYFGNSSGGDHTFFMSLAGNNNQARAVLNLGNGESQGASAEPGTGEIHHYVAVVSNDTIFWYVDGALAQKTATPTNYLIKDIAGSTAWLGYGAYGDPTWLGTTHEFNIYKGQMDAATVAARAQELLGDISKDATLSSLTIDAGDLIPAFDPAITNYSVIIPAGTSTVNVAAVANDAKSTVEGDGAIDVSSGKGTASVKVTAENGAVITYTIQFAVPSEYTLMHSYPFNDGTANDVVGMLHGTVFGNVTIANGAATVAPEANGAGQNYGYISLDGTSLLLNTYSAITTEAFIVAGDGTNDSYTMLYYFGDNTSNYLFSQMTQGTTDANVKTTTPGGEVATLFGSTIDDGKLHHIVAVVTADALKFYVDGVLIQSSAGTGFITPIGTLFANLFRGPDGWNDDNWIGSIDEFNIYEGEMDAATIQERAEGYLKEATLMHSYTFEDGTAADVVGDLDGTVVGNVTIADGKATVDSMADGQGSNYGYISFDGAALALNSYSAITTEAYIVASDEDNDWFTMLYYFGNNAADYLFSQMTQAGDNVSNVKTTTTGGEKGASSTRIDDGMKHHVVAVLTPTSISYYVDGMLKGTTTGEGFITPIGTTFAHLFRGPDAWNDDNWIGSFEEFNIYDGTMNAKTIRERADAYLSDIDARLASVTSSVGSVVPNVNTGSSHFAVLVPEGTTSVTITATPYAATATVVGDGEVDLTAGETTITIEVTSTDGTVTKKYTVDIVFDDPTCADGLNADNQVVDPEMTDLSKWQGWGSKSIVYGMEAYCGGSSMKLGNGADGCDAALDIAPFDFQPNTTYRVRAMVKTIGGSIGFLAKGSDPDFGFAFDSNGEWMQLDTVFTTGANPTDNFISFNKCDFGSNCTYAYVDNYEIFVDDGTAAVEISEATIKVYPTYSAGDFKVQTTGNRGMITVYNLTGKLVLQKAIESNLETVTVNGRGMYIMRVEAEDATATFKVIKTE